MKDFDIMTVGMILDYIDEYDNLHNPENKQGEVNIREATQADFDNF